MSTKRLPAIVTHIRSLTPTSFELGLKRLGGDRFPDFRPGQYATISFPDYPRLRGERSFSIASAPTDTRVLRFGIRVEGKYTTALRNLQPGDRGMVAGPYGHFTFESQRDQSVVLIAGGVGITPFVSMVRAATDRQLQNDLTLLYSVRSLSDAPFANEINQLAAVNPHLRVVYAISDRRVPNQPERYVPGRMNAAFLQWALRGDFRGRSIFLCGPPAFMTTIIKALRSLGVPTSSIQVERFGIGSSALIERGTPVPKYVFAVWATAATIVLGIIIRVERVKRSAAVAAPIVSPAAISQPSIPKDTPALVPTPTSANSVNPPASPTVIPTIPATTYRPSPIVPRTRVS